MKRRSFLTTCATTALLAYVPVVRAQDKVIRLIVPFAPGGSGDLIPRILAPALSEILQETVIVENKPGAGGTLGTSYVSRAAPDGLTLGVATVSTHAIQPAVRAQPPYNPLSDFSAISNLADVPNIISINSSVPAKNIETLVKLAKQRDQDLTYGSPGVGSLGHMMGELLAQSTGAKFRHVPYRGGGPALQDAIAGHINMLCDNLPASLPHVLSGRLRAMGIAWPSRVSQLPDVPTFAEVGIDPLNDAAWFGLVGPAGLSADKIQRLQRAVALALQSQAVSSRIIELGAVPLSTSPEAFSQKIQSELDKWRSVARTANISLES